MLDLITDLILSPLIDDVLKKKFVFIGFSAWLLL